MDRSTGQIGHRLTGLLFLLALAVILAPLLFDGEGLPPATELEPAEALVLDRPLVTLDEVRAREQRLRPERSGTVRPVEDLGELEQAAAELRERVDDAQFAAPNAAGEQERPGEPGLAPVASSTRVYAVQVASFAEQANAEALQRRLRDAGYEAFLTAVRVAGETYTRVAVGPYLSRQQADGDLANIERRFDLDAKLMAMIL
ncbi:MAG: SPOR domain-containing protein [Pseudomonadota bacterium]